MEFTIEPGIILKLEKIVQPADSAIIYGSGAVDVFSTPAMIAFMERTAYESVQGLLPEGYTTVGTEVNIKHLRATLVGKQVKCQSLLIDVDGRKLIFEVTSSDDKGEIGTGKHTRFIIEKRHFIEKLEQSF